MEYRKSYKGLVLWLMGYMAVMFAPSLFQAMDEGLLMRVFLNLTSLAVVGLMAVIWKTESVYWINGIDFEQARDAGSARRRAFAMAHLKPFVGFAVIYALFSAAMQWLGVSSIVDIIAFTTGLIVAALSTRKIEL